jgi:antitoxin component YwqK of YwqJK toxin-antitoxin module
LILGDLVELTVNNFKYKMSRIYLQIPNEKSSLEIEIVAAGNKFLIKEKSEMQGLYKNLFRWISKNSKLSNQDYTGYVNARAAHPTEDFGIANNPYSKSVSVLAKSLFGSDEVHTDQTIPSDPFNKPSLDPNPANVNNLFPSEPLAPQGQQNTNKPSTGQTILMDETNTFQQFKVETSNGIKQGQGTEFYENGKPKYVGRFMNDTPNDPNGAYYYENGTKMYQGSVINGNLSGNGCIYHENGTLGFQGSFKENSPNGNIEMFDRYGNLSYKGNYANNQKSGTGKEFYYNGKIKFQGEFKGDGPHGVGCVLFGYFGNKEFEGEMNCGQKSRGKLYLNSGAMYFDGGFMDDMPHGANCVTHYETGAVHYQGGLDRGQYHGVGKLMYGNGVVLYQGTFVDGNINNKMACIYASDGGMKYKGPFPVG